MPGERTHIKGMLLLITTFLFQNIRVASGVLFILARGNAAIGYITLTFPSSVLPNLIERCGAPPRRVTYLIIN
jgi:hypothetical protein